MARVGKVTSWRSISVITSRPNFSDVVISQAGLSGPCSAWPRRSVATREGSALSSAMTRISVGPARQIDAHETEELPLGLGDVGVAGTGDHVDRPHADAAIGHGASACTPPSV